MSLDAADRLRPQLASAVADALVEAVPIYVDTLAEIRDIAEAATKDSAVLDELRLLGAEVGCHLNFLVRAVKVHAQRERWEVSDDRAILRGEESCPSPDSTLVALPLMVLLSESFILFGFADTPETLTELPFASLDEIESWRGDPALNAWLQAASTPPVG
jgi:hypothetical protein